MGDLEDDEDDQDDDEDDNDADDDEDDDEDGNVEVEIICDKRLRKDRITLQAFPQLLYSYQTLQFQLFSENAAYRKIVALVRTTYRQPYIQYLIPLGSHNLYVSTPLNQLSSKPKTLLGQLFS